MTARTKVILSSGVVTAVLAAIAWLVLPASPQSAALASRQRAMAMLGARIAELRPHCKVLVLSNPFARTSGYLSEKSRYERAGLRGLRHGLGRGSPAKVVFPELRPEYLANPQSVFIPPDSRTPLSFLVRLASVGRLAEAHADHCVIVSLIGLPLGVERLKIWGEGDPRCFALLLPDLRVLGSPTEVIEAFRRAKLLAAVVEDSRSGDPLLVTRENIVDVLTRQPQVLGY
ncbi:MAG: hypothetical protein HS113_30535 [Verrucomicrobiales bacterium]|nr:hypothetical protein [Verrucomicrobiales bacterium]